MPEVRPASRLVAAAAALAGACCSGTPADDLDGGTAAQCLTQASQALPRITAVAPADVDTGGGEVLTITGDNFAGPGATVALGSDQCRDVNVKAATSITCITPQVRFEGVVDVTVTNGGASGGLSSRPCAGVLEFKDLKGPKVTEIFPPENSCVSVLVSARITFNEPIDPATVTPETVFVEKNGARIDGGVFCDVDCKRACAGATGVTQICIGIPEPIDPGATYVAVLRCTIADLRGHAMTCPGRDEFRFPLSPRPDCP